MSETDPSGLRGTGAEVRIEDVTKRYGAVLALDRVSLDIRAGEFITLLGASGSGKSTLLNVLAGFTEPTAGRVEVDGTDLTRTPPHRRNLGMVFQDYQLFPHMSVFDNVAFPLRRRRLPKHAVQERVGAALDVVELGHLGRRRPAELSGGQQQRVALARALVFRPPVLLMDEPLGALDKRLREQLQLEIRRLHRELGTTFVFVTHDQEEALAMSDRVALLRDGRVVQVGTPEDLYERPSSGYVAEFLGESNIFRGRLDGDTVVEPDTGIALAAPPGAERSLPDAASRAAVGLVVRPEHVTLRPAGSPVPDGSNALDGVVGEVTYAGASRRVEVRSRSGHRLVARTGAGGDAHPATGTPVTVSWPQDAGVIVPDDPAASNAKRPGSAPGDGPAAEPGTDDDLAARPVAAPVRGEAGR